MFKNPEYQSGQHDYVEFIRILLNDASIENNVNRNNSNYKEFISNSINNFYIKKKFFYN